MAQTPTEAPREEPDSDQPSKKPRTWLILLSCLGILYTLYLASSLFIPLTAALFIALFLNPLVTSLQRIYVPRTISSLALLAALLLPVGLLAANLAEPLERWLERLPELSTELVEELDSLEQSLQPDKPPQPAPVEEEPDEGFSFFGLFDDDKEKEAAPEPQQQPQQGPSLSERVMYTGAEAVLQFLSGAPVVVAQLLTVIYVVLFLLVFGPGLYNTALRELPMVHDAERTSRIVTETQRELSRYILLVSAINAALGCCVALALSLAGVDDALLWGVIAALLNFAPYVGPLLGICVLALAGLVQYGAEPAAVIPALIYFGVNLIEANFVTPLVLGQRFRLNPLVVILWMIILAWLWGPVGVLLAVPMLVCLKLVAGRASALSPWIRVLETRP